MGKVVHEKYREYFAKHFEDVMVALNKNKDKILNTYMNCGREINIRIPFVVGDVPLFEIYGYRLNGGNLEQEMVKVSKDKDNGKE